MKSLTKKTKRAAARKHDHRIAAVVEMMESRILMTVLADWTFESTAPANAGPFSPEIGAGQAMGHHQGSSTYSSPVGNGSSHSFSSNTWAPGDYYQFEVNSAGQQLTTFAFDQTSSGTGPGNFKVQYSTDGVNFTDLSGGTYATGSTAWSSGTGQPSTTHTFTLDPTSQAALSNQSTAYFRLVDLNTTSAAGGTVGTAGTDRVDNVNIVGNPESVPTIDSLSVNPTSVVVNSGTTISLTAHNVQDPSGNTITGVSFYLGSVSPSNLISTGTLAQNGNDWTLSGVSTNGLPTGNTTYLAVANDDGGLNSASVSTTLNVTAAQQVGLSATSYSVNEAAGTVTITVNRTGDTTGTATVNYSTSDGPHFADPNNPNVDGAAVANNDYTTTTGTLTFDANDTQKSFTVPILDVKTFPDTRTFEITLTQGSGATITAGEGAAAVAIADDTVTAPGGIDTPTGITTESYNVEPTAGAGTANSFMPLAFNNHNGFASASMPEMEFGAGSTVFVPGEQAAAIDSIKLSLFNTSTTGNFAGVPGQFDVYLLTDDTVAATSLTYAAGGDTGPAVLGTPPEGGAIFVGTGTFTNNTVGYNDYTFDNLSPAVQTALKAYFNGTDTSSTGIRFVITPSSGSPMSADWEGNFTRNQPVLTMLVEKATAAPLPSYITPSVGAQFTWDNTTGNLVLTGGTLTFTQDQATSGDTTDPLVNLTAENMGSTVIFNTSQHLAGLTLSGGATATVLSLGDARTHDNHNVLVIGTVDQSTAPTFYIDSISQLDLTDNDMIIHNGDYASVAGLAALGRNGTTSGLLDGNWMGDGLTSSAAATADANAGFEQIGLAVVQNGSQLFGQMTDWQVGSFDEPLRTDGNDIIVKYTYTGDFDLSGTVDANDATIFTTDFGSSGNTWASGDMNLDGTIDSNDATAFTTVFGDGSGGVLGQQL